MRDLLEEDVPNKILKVAKIDHVMWKKRLADMMVGIVRLQPDELSSHEACRLGKWYYGPASLPFRASAPFQALEAPHRLVHQHGIAAVKAYNEGDNASAMESITNLRDASDQVIELLSKLELEVPQPAVAGAGGVVAF